MGARPAGPQCRFEVLMGEMATQNATSEGAAATRTRLTHRRLHAEFYPLIRTIVDLLLDDHVQGAEFGPQSGSRNAQEISRFDLVSLDVLQHFA